MKIDKDLFSSDLTIIIEFTKEPVMCQSLVYSRCIFSQSHARKRLRFLESVGLVCSKVCGRRREYHLTQKGWVIAQHLLKIQEILDDPLYDQVGESYPLAALF